MKTQRQAKILEIISTTIVDTQEQLLALLQEEGFHTTQATISRDIKELRIVKELTSLGNYRYTTGNNEIEGTFSARLNTIFKECVTGYDYAQNIVVVHCLPGMAQAACAAMDSLHWSQVIGTLAGDDTFICIVTGEREAEDLVLELKKMLSDTER